MRLAAALNLPGVDIAEALQGIFREEITPGEANRLTLLSPKIIHKILPGK